MSTLELSIGSFELTSQIHLVRQKALTGELNRDDMKKIAESLRATRGTVAPTTAGSRTTAARAKKTPTKSGEDLLSDFEGASGV